MIDYLFIYLFICRFLDETREKGTRSILYRVVYNSVIQTREDQSLIRCLQVLTFLDTRGARTPESEFMFSYFLSYDSSKIDSSAAYWI